MTFIHKSFIFVLKPIRLFGLLPLEVSKDKSQLQPSKPWTVYSVLLFILLFSLYTFCIYTDYLIVPMTYESRILYVGASVPIFTTEILAFVSGIRNSGKIAAILNQLSKIDEKLNFAGIYTSYKKINMYLLVEFVFYACLMTFRTWMGCYLIELSFCEITDSAWQDIYRVLSLKHFSCYILYVRQKYYEINNSLLRDEQFNVGESPTVVQEQLLVIFDVNLELKKICLEVTDIFKLQIVFYLFNNFMEMTLLFYWNMEFILGNQFWSTSTSTWIVTAFWPLGLLYELYSTISLCQDVEKQVLSFFY